MRAAARARLRCDNKHGVPLFLLLGIIFMSSAPSDTTTSKRKSGGKRTWDERAMDAALKKVWDHKETTSEFPPLSKAAKPYNASYAATGR